MTADPLIHNHELDFSLFFDIGPEMNHCLVAPDQHDYYFQDNYKSKYLQMVLSDRVPNCLLEAMERQLGTLPLIVEDLGCVRDDVRTVQTRLGYPGMRGRIAKSAGTLAEMLRVWLAEKTAKMDGRSCGAGEGDLRSAGRRGGALGARVVEKHFTDDTQRVGPDHGFSMDPITWRAMIRSSTGP